MTGLEIRGRGPKVCAAVLCPDTCVFPAAYMQCLFKWKENKREMPF